MNQPSQGDPTSSPPADRAPRFESHALVEVKSPWNPFSASSAVLLDLSVTGFKIEFVNSTRIKQGATLTMSIPLAPFDIKAPARVKLKIIVKWFDEKQMRAGGIFLEITEQQKYLVERVLTYILDRHQP